MQPRFREAKKPSPNYTAISGRLWVQAALFKSLSTVCCLSALMYSEAGWLNYKAANISSALVKDQIFSRMRAISFEGFSNLTVFWNLKISDFLVRSCRVKTEVCISEVVQPASWGEGRVQQASQ